MRTYVKPTIEFIELKPEERLACGSQTSCMFDACPGTTAPCGQKQCTDKNPWTGGIHGHGHSKDHDNNGRGKGNDHGHSRR